MENERRHLTAPFPTCGQDLICVILEKASSSRVESLTEYFDNAFFDEMGGGVHHSYVQPNRKELRSTQTRLKIRN